TFLIVYAAYLLIVSFIVPGFLRIITYSIAILIPRVRSKIDYDSMSISWPLILFYTFLLLLEAASMPVYMYILSSTNNVPLFGMVAEQYYPIVFAVYLLLGIPLAAYLFVKRHAIDKWVQETARSVVGALNSLTNESDDDSSDEEDWDLPSINVGFGRTGVLVAL